MLQSNTNKNPGSNQTKPKIKLRELSSSIIKRLPSNKTMVAFEYIMEVISQPGKCAEDADEDKNICNNAHRNGCFMVILSIQKNFALSCHVNQCASRI